jgi:predicted nucleic acid-binding protein
MPGYLLDTNVLISWFSRDGDSAKLAALISQPETRLFTSIICLAEFLAGCSPEDESMMKAIIDSGEIGIINFDSAAMAQNAARLRKSLNVKLPDAIVAATAKHRNLILFTLDKDLVKKLSGKIKTFVE